MKRLNQKRIVLGMVLSAWCFAVPVAAQENTDTTDIFYKHLELNEVIVTGLTGETKMKFSPTPVSIVSGKELRQIASTNIIDAIARQPGIAQITTGSGISKPVIRGLGYNRIVTISDGVRQEGQQWGDEHGIEVDAQGVSTVEILKGPASLMYGSDAMAGVVIFHSMPIASLGEMTANINTEYQTNNGLFDYSLSLNGNQSGIVWNARYSEKMAHAYKNKYDGYVPNSQFHERALSGMIGLHRQWGQSHLRLGYYHLTPSIIEGERDEVTGELISDAANIKTYGKTLPFQQVYHYKAISDNTFNLPSGYLKAIIGYQQNQRKEYEESPDEYNLYFQLHTLSYDIRYMSLENNGWKMNGGIGGMYQRSLNKGDEYLIPAYRLFDIGAYVTGNKRLNDWTFSGGVRIDRRQLHSERLIDDDQLRFTEFSRHFTGVTGSLGAVFNATENLNFRLNISRGFRAPNMSELGSNGVHEGTERYEVGNHDLKPEYSWQADFGMDFTSKYISAQVALFANRIDNYVFSHRVNEIIEPGYDTYEFTQGDARLLGFEAGFDFHPIHQLHFANSFSFVDARQLHQPKETKYLPMTPAPRWTADLKYEFTHNGRWLNNSYVAFGLDCNLRQNHYYMADDTETATPSYTLLNISAGTDVKFKGKKVAEVHMTIDNLTNRAYQNHLSRLKYTDFNVVTRRQGVFNMGRNITFKVMVPIHIL